MKSNIKILYAPITALRTKATKVVVLRAKSNTFRAVSAERTAQLVANATGFERPITFSETDGSMYQ